MSRLLPILLVLCLTVSTAAMAQERTMSVDEISSYRNRNASAAATASGEEQPTEKKKSQGYWTAGGGLGLSFGSGYTSLAISPQIGYRFNKYVELGGGINYSHHSDRDWDYKYNYTGINVYAKAYPISYIVILAQPELQYVWGSVGGRKISGTTFGTLLLGGGVVIPTGGRGGLNITVYYDVLQHRYSPYRGNIGYSVGYTFFL